jgi:hypothetical protein
LNVAASSRQVTVNNSISPDYRLFAAFLGARLRSRRPG